MANRKIQAKEAIQKRLRNPKAAVERLKGKLNFNRKTLAQFMEMTEEEKRKMMRSKGYGEGPFEEYIKGYKDTIASLEKTIASPQTTEVMPQDDKTTLYRGRIIFLFCATLLSIVQV